MIMNGSTESLSDIKNENKSQCSTIVHVSIVFQPNGLFTFTLKLNLFFTEFLQLRFDAILELFKSTVNLFIQYKILYCEIIA